MSRLVSSAVLITTLLVPMRPVLSQAPGLLLPKGTLIPVELVAPISSEQAKNGDRFAIRVFEPVTVGGKVIVPVGTLGEGEVIHAAKARGMGMPGELIVAARFLQCGSIPIRVGHLQFSQHGYDQTIGWIVAMAVHSSRQVKGGLTDLPTGTRGIAKVAEDTPLPSASACFGTVAPSQEGANP